MKPWYSLLGDVVIIAMGATLLGMAARDWKVGAGVFFVALGLMAR